MNFKKIFLLNLKKILMIIILFVIFVILHNAVYAITGIEEAFFFILAVMIVPLYFIISVVYTLIHKLR
ncbi:MAG: hypothetical protein ABIG89_05860 [Candidatus Woesearchaeota archaeon]